ncbi:TusA-related sulfurtransferase [Psychrobacter luti]|uniref:TusA-related sulfurtransferase n=1 Tax=Psychrobacter luti TaxID=198481 RepID=A0A839TB24_9GAMM|nr:sulfurtransferase TusA family protein [Psychrobacter luti]MBB3106692.1 TusA-related sulfurtransferase [Psychrobacter luti]
MSANNQSIIVRGSHAMHLSETVLDTLPEAKQQPIRQLLKLLPADTFSSTDNCKTSASAELTHETIIIKDMVDGRGLACPMPLLKTKVALRHVAAGESLYVVATDPNSQADITAFCEQNQKTDTVNPLLLVVNQATAASSEEATATQSKYSVDTIYHFIITKTDSN